MTVPEQADTPRGVEMPRPTLWPLVLSLGLALAGLGAALDTLAFLALGGVLFLAGLWGWMGELLPGRGTEIEPMRPSAATVVTRSEGVEQFEPGMRGYRFRLPEKIHPISAGLKGGLVGGLVMPIPALLWGLLSGHGIWFPVNLLAGIALPGVGDLSVSELEEFRPTLLALAVVIHAAMSAVIGLLYGVLLPTIPGAAHWHILVGGAVLPLIWTGFSYGFMGVANPPLERNVDWLSFAAAQVLFGLAAAVVVVRSEKVAVPPAGHGVSPAPLILLALLSGYTGGCGNAPGKPLPPSEPDRPSEVKDFGTLYGTHCAGCHGADGTLGPAPPLNDPLFLRSAPDTELLMVITNGRPGTPMPPFARSNGGPLTATQVKILADGLKTTWGKPGGPADVPEYASRQPADVSRGQALFSRACAGCHGERGQGGTFDGRYVGAINVPAFLALSSDQVLRRYVITGRPDLGMPDYAGKEGRPPDFRPLSSQDVTDLTALLASWRQRNAGK
jgi:cytochrome c oxidase cbb3-type subunit 3/ubiquinol-cytochrome c reductase cytochrome c subunit